MSNQEEETIKPPKVVYEPGIEWKIYSNYSAIKIYIGYEASKEIYHACTIPPIFSFVPGAWDDVLVQMTIVEQLYTIYLKEQKEKSSV